MSKLSDYNDILTLDDLQDILHIGKNKAYELCRTGSIKAFRVDREWRILKKYIEDFIQEKMH